MNTAPTVLVVDNDESSATFVTRVLGRAGYVSHWVVTADRASEMLAVTEYDVLVTANRLPGRSGLELVKEQREVRQDIAIAVMTAFNEADLARNAFSVGADLFFEKPLIPSTFLAGIDELVAARRRVAAVTVEDDREGDDRSGPPSTGASEPSGLATLGSFRQYDGVAGTAAFSAGSRGMTPGVAFPAGATTERPPQAEERRVAGPRGPGDLTLWASTAPGVGHVVSAAGFVVCPKTSIAWSPPA